MHAYIPVSMCVCVAFPAVAQLGQHSYHLEALFMYALQHVLMQAYIYVCLCVYLKYLAFAAYSSPYNKFISAFMCYVVAIAPL